MVFTLHILLAFSAYDVYFGCRPSVTRQGIDRWACAEGGPPVVGVVLVGVVLEVVAIMVEDMGIWVGGVATLTLTTNHDTKDPYAFQKKHMNDYGEEWPICLET